LTKIAGASIIKLKKIERIMIMLINKELCKECGACITECPSKAIVKNDAGEYSIDSLLCTECEACLDIECIRHCKFNAIVGEDGKVPEYDRTKRLLSNHIAYLVAIMGDRGRTGHFPIDNREWIAFRKLIAAAFTDPELKIRIVYGYDDICIGCKRKQGDCIEAAGGLAFAQLGIEPGTVMRFWDMIQLIEDKYSMPFLKKCGYSDEFINCVRTFVSPDAKMLTNE
jgi:ferredoxin